MPRLDAKRLRLKPLSVTWPAAMVFAATFSLPAFVYLNRFLVPDYSFDTLTYHLFNGWRGWTTGGSSFSIGEFYPSAVGNLPPFLDELFVPARLVLGYRLGTLPGLVAYWFGIGAAIGLARRMLATRHGRLTVLHALTVLYAVTNLEMLFQLATYFVDILNMALLLCALYFVVRFNAALKQGSAWRRLLVAASLCYGLAMWGKLTDVAFFAPGAVTVVWALFISARAEPIALRTRLCWFGVSATLMLAPIATVWVGNVVATGDPVFPLANHLFHSPYMQPINLAEANPFGGKTAMEKLLFPLFSIAEPSQLAEPNGLYTDYQLTATWIAALLLTSIHVVRRRRPTAAVTICLFNYLAGMLIWSWVFGVERYAAFGLIVGGVLLIPLMQEIRMLVPSVRTAIAVAAVAVCAILFQVAHVAAFNLQYDMSWRPTLVHDSAEYLAQRPYLFDNNVRLPLAPADVRSIDITLACAVATTGYVMVSVLRDRPMVDIIDHPGYTPLVEDPAYHHEVVRRLHLLYPGKSSLRFAAFATRRGLDPTEGPCLQALKDHGAHDWTVVVLPDFVGYGGQTLDLIIGEFPA